MPKKRDRRGRSARSAQQAQLPRRGNRVPFLIITLLAAFATLALVVAGFLNYSTPTTAPAVAPTFVPITTPQALSAPWVPLGIVFLS
ncbi:MAG TPA: hypothetical protein VKX96_16365 [Chloroflexota bacterium]|jgi:hypothetical protein|nr:hypothetical protein [Chloroflexota bacterium]